MKYQEGHMEKAFNILTNLTYDLSDRLIILNLIDNIESNALYTLRGSGCGNFRMEIADESEINDAQHDIIRLSFDSFERELNLMTSAFEILIRCDNIVISRQRL